MKWDLKINFKFYFVKSSSSNFQSTLTSSKINKTSNADVKEECCTVHVIKSFKEKINETQRQNYCEK